MLARVTGIDVSHHQGVINWHSVAGAGYEFAFVRATEGVGNTDARVAANFAGGADAGMLLGAYHHAKPDAATGDAVAEANYFIQQAGAYMGSGHLRPALDVSEGAGTGGLTKSQLSSWVNTFLSTVKGATGVEPVIYANNDYVTNYLDSTVAADHDLWIARWSTAYGDPLTTGSPPTGTWAAAGETWDFWQYTNAGSVAGIAGAVDRNVFNGDRDALDRFVIQEADSATFRANLDFAPVGAAIAAGYSGVASAVYGAQGGYQMGWSAAGVTTFARTGGTAPDTRYRTYAMPHAGGVQRNFEIAVPDGVYSVRVVAGSPDQYPHASKLIVEGTVAINGTNSSTNTFISGTVTVAVTDGRLTIASDAAAPNTRLGYVDITQTASLVSGRYEVEVFRPAITGGEFVSSNLDGLTIPVNANFDEGNTAGGVPVPDNVLASTIAKANIGDEGGDRDLVLVRVTPEFDGLSASRRRTARFVTGVTFPSTVRLWNWWPANTHPSEPAAHWSPYLSDDFSKRVHLADGDPSRTSTFFIEGAAPDLAAVRFWAYDAAQPGIPTHGDPSIEAFNPAVAAPRLKLAADKTFLVDVVHADLDVDSDRSLDGSGSTYFSGYLPGRLDGNIAHRPLDGSASAPADLQRGSEATQEEYAQRGRRHPVAVRYTSPEGVYASPSDTTLFTPVRVTLDTAATGGADPAQLRLSFRMSNLRAWAPWFGERSNSWLRAVPAGHQILPDAPILGADIGLSAANPSVTIYVQAYTWGDASLEMWVGPPVPAVIASPGGGISARPLPSGEPMRLWEVLALRGVRAGIDDVDEQVDGPIPFVTSSAGAGTTLVDGTTVELSARATDDGGADGLTYTWTPSLVPTDAPVPTFDRNGSSDANSATATFYKAGTYTFRLLISDRDGNEVDGGNVTVVVDETLTSIAIAPILAGVDAGQSYAFSAEGFDQFEELMGSQPDWQWTVDPASGAGAIDSEGIYTAPLTGSAETAIIRAAYDGVAGIATVVLIPAVEPPSGVIATPADDAKALRVAWTDVALDEDGYRVDLYTRTGQLVKSVELPADSTEVEITALTEATAYLVVVSAIVTGSPPASVAVPGLVYTRLEAPTGITANRGTAGLRVTWTDNSKRELGYQVRAIALDDFTDESGQPVPADTVLESKVVPASPLGIRGGSMAADLTAIPVDIDIRIEVVAIGETADRSSIPAAVLLASHGGSEPDPADPWQGVDAYKQGFPFDLHVGANRNSSVDITGVPIPEPSPTGEGEDDRRPNASRVEMFGLTPSFSATDIAVPMVGGELLLEVRRNQSIENVNFTSAGTDIGALPGAARANFRWESEQILGPTWSSNLAIRAIQTESESHQAWEPRYKVTVVDEGGVSMTYASNDRGTWHPYVKTGADNDAFKATLITDGSGYVLRKAFGTELHFESFGGNAVDRGLTVPGQRVVETYLRIARIVDRNNNELRYAYDDATSHHTLPVAIYDPSLGSATSSPRRIELEYGDVGSGGAEVVRLVKARDPLGKETDYRYVSNGSGRLASVEKPAVIDGRTNASVRPTVRFTYQDSNYAGNFLRPRTLRSDAPSLAGFVFNAGGSALTGWIAPKTIEDANGNVTTFDYIEEYMPSSIRNTTNVNTMQDVVLFEFRPRLTSVTTATGTAAENTATFETVARELLHVTTRVTDARGVATDYTYDLQKVRANNDLGFGLVVQELTRRTDALEAGDPDPTVVYTYGNGLLGNLVQVQDVSGNVVQFIYDSGETAASDPYNDAIFDVGGTFYNRYALYERPARSVLDAGGPGHLNLTTEYRYETNFNKLVLQTDPAGTKTKYVIDSHGNRTSMIVGFGSSIAARSSFEYDANGFMTRSESPDHSVTEYSPNAFGQTEYTIVKGRAGEDLTPLPGSSFYPDKDPDARWIVTRSQSDVMGRVSASYDPTGDVTTYGYDDLGRQLSVTSPAVPDPSNLSTFVTSTAHTFYDPNGNAVRMQDDNVNVTTMTYDAFNNVLLTRRRMLGPMIDSTADLITERRYDGVGLLRYEIDAEENVTEHRYDELQRLSKTILPTVTLTGESTAQYETTYEYGANSGSGAFTLGGFNPTRVINARGYATDSEYDRAYRATSNVRRRDDGAGLASDAEARSGEPATLTQYDAVGKPVLVTVLNETRTGGTADRSADRNVYTFYDSRHQAVATVTDLDNDGPGLTSGGALLTPGTVVESASTPQWDADDIVTRARYDLSGQLQVATDANGGSTVTTYDGAGRATEVRLPRVDRFENGAISTNVTPVTAVQFDADGRAAITRDARGTQTRTHYDARGRVVATILDLDGDGEFETNGEDVVNGTGYDLGGRVIYSIDPRNNRTDTEYDRADRVHIVRASAVADAENGGHIARPTTVTEYDRNGRVLSITDPRNVVTTTQYDELGRARFVIANATATSDAAERLETESRYDENGNVIALVLHNGSYGDQTTTYTFDAFDRRKTETLPSVGDNVARTTTTYYDRAGGAITTVDPKGQSVETDYDRAGRVSAQRFYNDFGIDSSGHFVSTGLRETRASSYDRVGNLLSRSDLNGTSTYTYDALNRQKTERRVDSAVSGTNALAADDYTVSSWFDLNGNRTKVVYPTTNRTLLSKYNRAGQMTELKEGGKTTTFEYDRAGNRTLHVQPNGQRTVAVFDPLNRVTSFTTTGTGSVAVYSTTYGYDLAGQRRTSTEAIAGFASRELTWVYDGLYRLTGEAWTGTEAQVRAYTYDPAGNRRTRTVTPAGGPGVTTLYEYDVLNRLKSFSGGTKYATYDYDENGNRTAKYGDDGSTTYVYDTQNRLTDAYVPGGVGGTNIEFHARYDARSRRISKVEGGAKTRYRYDGGTNFQELDVDGNVALELIRAGGLGGGIGSVLYSDRRIEPATPGGVATKKTEFFAYNAVGHTVALTDAAGTATQRSLYETFGETVIQDGLSKNNRLANTKERDASIGLDNHGFRYYDSAVGRYVTRDPIGYGDGLNVYASVKSNPVNSVDPLGLSAWDTAKKWVDNLTTHGDPVGLGLRAAINTVDDYSANRSDGDGRVAAAGKSLAGNMPVASAITHVAEAYNGEVWQGQNAGHVLRPLERWGHVAEGVGTVALAGAGAAALLRTPKPPPLPVKSAATSVAEGQVATGATAGSGASPEAAQVIAGRPAKFGPYYRSDRPETVSLQEKSGEMWGRPARNTYASDFPKVKAYEGPIPKGTNGAEFYTNVAPDPHGIPGKPTWSGTPGEEWAKIPVVITKAVKDAK